MKVFESKRTPEADASQRYKDACDIEGQLGHICVHVITTPHLDQSSNLEVYQCYCEKWICVHDAGCHDRFCDTGSILLAALISGLTVA